MPATLSFDSASFADRLKAAQDPQAQIEIGARALGEAFDARDKYTLNQEQELQSQAATLQALQNAVQKLQEVQAHRDAQYAASREGALELGYQVKALEENARRDVAQRASKADVEGVRSELREVRTELKSDIALVHKEVDVLRAETKVGFAEMENRFTKADAKVDLLRKDMQAMENRMVIRLGGLIVVMAGLMLAFLRMFPAAAA